MSIKVNVFLELVGLVPFTDRVRCKFDLMAHYCIIGNALGYPWVIYACSDVINEHERVGREHAYGPHDLSTCWSLWPSTNTMLNYGTGDPGSIPSAVHFLNFVI
jgi:hypothetical protein